MPVTGKQRSAIVITTQLGGWTLERFTTKISFLSRISQWEESRDLIASELPFIPFDVEKSTSVSRREYSTERQQVTKNKPVGGELRDTV